MPTTAKTIELRTVNLARAAESGNVRDFMRAMVRATQEIEQQWPKIAADLVNLTDGVTALAHTGAKAGTVSFNDSDGKAHVVVVGTGGIITSWKINAVEKLA